MKYKRPEGEAGERAATEAMMMMKVGGALPMISTDDTTTLPMVSTNDALPMVSTDDTTTTGQYGRQRLKVRSLL
jgi:hypothetical protein